MLTPWMASVISWSTRNAPLHSWVSLSVGVLLVFQGPTYGPKDPGTNSSEVPSDTNFEYSAVKRTLVMSLASYSHFERAARSRWRKVGVPSEVWPKPSIW